MHRWIVLVGWLLLGSVLRGHPIKMTTGKVQFHSNDTVAELVFNFFIDDFESEMRKMYPQPPFNYENATEEMIASIQDYIRKNVSFQLGKSISKLSILAVKKIDDNVCQVSMSIYYAASETLKEIKVRNTLLFSSFDKQSNILHVLVDDESPQILQFYPNHPVAFVKR